MPDPIAYYSIIRYVTLHLRTSNCVKLSNSHHRYVHACHQGASCQREAYVKTGDDGLLRPDLGIRGAWQPHMEALFGIKASRWHCGCSIALQPAFTRISVRVWS